MSEETKRANVAGPWGMIAAVIGSSLMGWFFLISLITGIHDYEQTVRTKTGFPVTQVLLDNFGRSWTLVLMSCLLMACWFCGLVTVTSNSRMIYAFSRDNAMVRRPARSELVFDLRRLFVAMQFPVESCQSRFGLSPQRCLVIVHHLFSSGSSLFDQYHRVHCRS